jgi:hypothetical protein
MAPRARRLWLTSAASLLVSLCVVGMARRAPATVAEQRARLPPAAECRDPLAGVWRAHLYRPNEGRWAINTMELRWSADHTKLLSSYENHFWNGGPDDGEPPPCRPGLYRRISSSTGEGSFAAGILKVRGTQLGPDRAVCGSATFQRALGVLEGTLDPEGNEFRSQMSSRFGVYPIVWRRIRCLDDATGLDRDTARPTVDDPPVAPAAPPPPAPSSAGGCSCEWLGL